MAARLWHGFRWDIRRIQTYFSQARPRFLFEHVSLCVKSARAERRCRPLEHSDSAPGTLANNKLCYRLFCAKCCPVTVASLQKNPAGLSRQLGRAKMIPIVSRAVGQLPKQFAGFNIAPFGKQSERLPNHRPGHSPAWPPTPQRSWSEHIILYKWRT